VAPVVDAPVPLITIKWRTKSGYRQGWLNKNFSEPVFATSGLGVPGGEEGAESSSDVDMAVIKHPRHSGQQLFNILRVCLHPLTVVAHRPAFAKHVQVVAFCVDDHGIIDTKPTSSGALNICNGDGRAIRSSYDIHKTKFFE
jgi:hypothetical protein